MGSVANVGVLLADAVRACPSRTSNLRGVRTRAGCGKAGLSDLAEIGRRGAQGAPWRLAEISHALWGTPAPEVPQGQARADLIAAHYEDMLSFYGTELGLRCARKHLGWSLEEAGLPQAREPILTATDPAQVIRLIGEAFAELEAVA